MRHSFLVRRRGGTSYAQLRLQRGADGRHRELRTRCAGGLRGRLTGGTLRPRNFQIIRETMLRFGRNSTWDWPKERLTAAIYLIVTSPEFAVLR